ncbi:MAG: hypothetical protein ABI847_13530 [Anaerolineales bacterium]
MACQRAEVGVGVVDIEQPLDLVVAQDVDQVPRQFGRLQPFERIAIAVVFQPHAEGFE